MQILKEFTVDMRILLIGFNRQYVNRTTRVIINALRAHHDLSFFGPGFTPQETLEGGIERWLDKTGPYDLIVFDTYVFEFDEIRQRKRPFAGDYIQFSKQAFEMAGPDLQSFAMSHKGRKLLIANWDVYGVGSQKIEKIIRSDCIVMDASMAKLTWAEKRSRYGITDDFMNQRGFPGGQPTDEWVRFIKSNPERVLSMPHAIGNDQFSYLPIEMRSENFTIPGTLYAERREVQHLTPLRQRFNKTVERASDRIYSQFSHSLSHPRMSKLHIRYDKGIEKSRFAYVSGSLYRFPVRKYFEVPALGAVPIGEVCEGFSELGFVEDVNFIVAEDAITVQRKLLEMCVHDAQRVAHHAQKLIFEKHSEYARSLQLAESIRRILEGRFSGSYWENGAYIHV